MVACQDYGAFLGPHWGYPKRDHKLDRFPYRGNMGLRVLGVNVGFRS